MSMRRSPSVSISSPFLRWQKTESKVILIGNGWRRNSCASSTTTLRRYDLRIRSERCSKRPVGSSRLRKSASLSSSSSRVPTLAGPGSARRSCSGTLVDSDDGSSRSRSSAASVEDGSCLYTLLQKSSSNALNVERINRSNRSAVGGSSLRSRNLKSAASVTRSGARSCASTWSRSHAITLSESSIVASRKANRDRILAR